MGKRSQAKHKWLTMSQRIKDGPGTSGARLWYRVQGLGGQPKPGMPREPRQPRVPIGTQVAVAPTSSPPTAKESA